MGALQHTAPRRIIQAHHAAELIGLTRIYHNIGFAKHFLRRLEVVRRRSGFSAEIGLMKRSCMRKCTVLARVEHVLPSRLHSSESEAVMLQLRNACSVWIGCAQPSSRLSA